LALLPEISAQVVNTAASQPAVSSSNHGAIPEEEVVVLSPFVVTSTGDRGYQAQSTLAGSRLKTDLKDVASPMSSFTQQFLEDLGVTSTDDLSRFMLSTEQEFGENAGLGQNFMKDQSTRAIRMRGLPGGTVSVNFFKSDFPTDIFSVDRIDQARGPNSVLFGIGSPGGIINVNSKRALLGKTTRSAVIQGRSNGGLRAEVDYNQAIGDRLALRVAAVNEKLGSWRNYEFADSERYYVTGKWRVGQKTEFNFDLETADITQQRKRSITAYDAYTNWVAAGSKLALPLTPTANVAINTANQISRLATSNTPYFILDTASGSVSNWVNKTRSTLRTSIEGDNVPFTDFQLIPKETVVYGPGFDMDTYYTRSGANLTHSFSRDLNLEVAGMRTRSSFSTWDSSTATTRAIYVDTNPTLPSGLANPYAGKTYVEALPQVTLSDQLTDSVRSVLSYTKDMGKWGKHTLAGVYQYDFSKLDIRVMREQVISPNAPNLTSAINNNNRVWRRTYVDLTGPSSGIVMAPFNKQALGTFKETVSGNTYTTALVPFNTNTQLNSFDDKTIIGMLQSSFWANRIKTIIGGSRDDRNDYASTQVLTPVAGFTSGIPTPVRSHVPYKVVAKSISFSGVLQATDWLGLTYSQAANSGLPNFSGRLNSTGSDLASFNRPPIPRGKSKDVGFKLDLFQKRLFVTAQYFQTTAERDFDFNNPLNSTINPIWDALALAGKVPSGTSSLSTGKTFDSYSQGYELEVIANPTEHWRMYLNYSNSQTSATKIGQEDLAYIATWRPTWETNAALPLSTGQGTIATQLVALDNAVFSNITLAEGKRQLGQIKQKLFLVSNYDFSTGKLKGFTIGGGVRYSSAPVISYSASGTPNNIISNVTYGSPQIFVDLNAAYRRKIQVGGKSIMWSLQTNINNVLNNDAFVRLNVARDGLVTSYRFNAPLEWLVTTKFSY
jgi:outer membrane receptor protein involved in Fe transport